MSKWIGAAASALFGLAPISMAQTADVSRDKVSLEADSIEDDQKNNRIIAEGNVRAAFLGRVLRADKVIYDLTTRKIRATGSVTIIDPDGTQRFADEVEVDETFTDGFAIGFSTRFAEGGIAAANSAVRQSDGINALDQAVYTACEVCEETGERPTWRLRARRAVLDENTETISYRDAVLEILGVPVLYAPFFFHPDPNSTRRSGFLPPRIQISQRLGAGWEQPYYRVIDKSSDITFTPIVYTNARPLIGAEYRKRFWSGQLEVSGFFTREFDINGDGEKITEQILPGGEVLELERENRATGFARGLFAINDNWQWGFGVERTTDDLFNRIYEIPGEGVRRGLIDSQPNVLVSQIFAVGQGQDFYVDGAVLSYQDLRFAGVDNQIPSATPILFAEKLNDFGAFGRTSITLSSAILNRSEPGVINGVEVGDNRRVSLGGEWRTTAILPGGFVVEPFAEARGDFYQLDEEITGDGEFGRGVGSLGATVAWPLVRTGSFVDLTLEPKILAAWGVAGANEVPFEPEDDLLYEFDEFSLFDANGFGNFDLYEGDGRLAAGLNATARFKDGTRLDFTGGRRWRSRADPAFDAFSNLDGTSSDWLANVAVDFRAPVRIDARARFDDEDFSLNRLDAGLGARLGPLRASGRYFLIDDSIAPTAELPPEATPGQIEGFLVSSELKITKNYSLLYSQRRNITASQNLSQVFGVAYEDECSRFELVFTRRENANAVLGSNDSIQFRFSLKNLGDFGTGDFR